MKYDLSALQATAAGKMERVSRALGVLLLTLFAAVGILIANYLVRHPPDFGTTAVVSLGFELFIVIFGMGMGAFVYRGSRGADEIEVDNNGVRAFKRGRRRWSRGWTDHSLLMRITAERSPQPGVYPEIFIVVPHAGRCNLTIEASNAIVTVARDHGLTIEVGPANSPRNVRTTIRSQVNGATVGVRGR